MGKGGGGVGGSGRQVSHILFSCPRRESRPSSPVYPSGKGSYAPLLAVVGVVAVREQQGVAGDDVVVTSDQEEK